MFWYDPFHGTKLFCVLVQAMSDALSEFYVKDPWPGYPFNFRVYRGGVKMLSAILDAGYHIPMYSFLVIEEEMKKDKHLKLIFETGPGFATICLFRRGPQKHASIGLVEHPEKFSKRQAKKLATAGLVPLGKFQMLLELQA